MIPSLVLSTLLVVNLLLATPPILLGLFLRAALNKLVIRNPIVVAVVLLTRGFDVNVINEHVPR